MRQQNIKRSFNSLLLKCLKRKSLIKSSHHLLSCQMDLTWHSENGWSSIPGDHTVNIRYPYAWHGLCGRTSNNAKVEAKEAFLWFIDANSQPNGRQLDSRNPTHYLLPRFKTISLPNKSVKDYHEKVKTSLVCEFNRTQLEVTLRN